MTNELYKLHKGDCADILPTLDIRPQLILTSPPYDNLRDYGGHEFDFDRVADAIVGVMPEGGVLVWVVGDATIDGSETGTSFRQALAFMDKGLRLHQTMHYQKTREMAFSPNRYAATTEYMFVFSKGIPQIANIIKDKRNVRSGTTWKRTAIGRRPDGNKEIGAGTFTTGPLGVRTNVWRYHVGRNGDAQPPTSKSHPAYFPSALASDHIRTWTNPGDLVLDPMCGSGTVLSAAVKLDRKAVGIEIHDEYCNLIRRRMESVQAPML